MVSAAISTIIGPAISGAERLSSPWLGALAGSIAVEVELSAAASRAGGVARGANSAKDLLSDFPASPEVSWCASRAASSPDDLERLGKMLKAMRKAAQAPARAHRKRFAKRRRQRRVR